MAINGFGYNEKNDCNIVVVNDAVYEVIAKEYFDNNDFKYLGEADEFENDFIDKLLPWNRVSQRLRDIHHDLLNRF